MKSLKHLKSKSKTYAILAGVTAVSIHIINQILNSLYNYKKYLRNPNNLNYEWRFGNINYSIEGSGTPIILIHDLSSGSSKYEYHRLLNALKESHCVYSLDLIGYGLSDKPNITYTNYLYVQLLIDFIKNIIGKKTTIITTGDSCSFSLLAGHNDPEIIDKMIFINPQSLYNLNLIPSKETKALKLFLETPVLGTFIFNMLSNRINIEKSFQNDYFYNHQLIQEKDILAYLEAAHYSNNNNEFDSGKYTFASYTGKYMNANIIHALKEVNHSIYIIAGENEKDIKTTIDNYKYYNSSIESFFIKKTKHLPHLESPDQVIDQIKVLL